MAAAIALGATGMSDIAVLAHLAPVPEDAPGGPPARTRRARPPPGRRATGSTRWAPGSRTPWQASCGWVIAANIAAGLTAWTRVHDIAKANRARFALFPTALFMFVPDHQ